MATRKKPAHDGEVIDSDDSENWGVSVAPALDLEPVEQTAAERLSAMLENASGIDRAKVSVFRMSTEKPGQMDFAQNYSVEDFEQGGDLDLIRSQFGAGRYSIRIFGTLPNSGKQGLLSHMVVSLLADPRPSMPVAVAPVAPANDALAQALTLIADGQRAILERLAAPPPAAPDPLVQMGALMALMGQMQTVMGGGKAPPPPPATPVSEALAIVRELRAASKELSPEGGSDEPSLLGMGAQVLDLVRQAQQNQPAPQMPIYPQHYPQAQPMPPVHVPPSLAFPPLQPHAPTPNTMPAPLDEPIPASGGNAPPSPPVAELDMSALPPDEQKAMKALQDLLAKTLSLAAAGKPAEEGAELLYAELPDELVEALWEETWFALLCQFAPAAVKHEAWLREAHAIICQWAEDDDKEENSIDVNSPASPEQSKPAAP